MRLEDLATSFARRYADSIIMKSVTIPIPSASVVKKASLKIGIAILLLYLSYVVREIWLPLVLAFLLAMILDPVVDRMEVRGWTRPRASAFIFGSFLIIFIGLIVLSYPLAAAQIDTLQKGFEKYFPDSSHAGLIKSLHKMGLAPNLAGGAVSVIESAKSSLQHSSSIITNYGMVIVSNASWIVIIPLGPPRFPLNSRKGTSSRSTKAKGPCSDSGQGNDFSIWKLPERTRDRLDYERNRHYHTAHSPASTWRLDGGSYCRVSLQRSLFGCHVNIGFNRCGVVCRRRS
jgi:hypothetical protein